MRDNHRSGARENVVAVHVIQVIVRVHYKPDRQLRKLADFSQQRRGGFRILKRVDNQNSVVADYESGIAYGLTLVIDDGGPHPAADLLQREVMTGGRGRPTQEKECD